MVEAATAPEGTVEVPTFVTETTPSGLEIKYHWAPKRKYEIWKPVRLHESSGAGGDIHPLDESEWVEVPSVTTVLGVLDKPALPWWGMKVGVEGVLDLFRQGVLRSSFADGNHFLTCPGPIAPGQSGLVVAGTEQVIDLLVKYKATVNHVRDSAGDRGAAVHDALELWAKNGDLPDPSIFPPEEQGYVIGLRRFLEDVQPEPEASEVMVGSLQDEFAGRYDVRLKTSEARTVVVHRTPKRGAQYAELPAGRYLTDLKTSKDVYDTHSLQLEAYEGASVESGHEATDGRGIIHVTPEGHYRFVRSRATYEDFLAVLAVYRALGDMKARK